MRWPWSRQKPASGQDGVATPASGPAPAAEPDEETIARRTNTILHLLNTEDPKYPGVNFYEELRGQVVKIRPALMRAGLGTHEEGVDLFVREWVREWVSGLGNQTWQDITSGEFSGEIYYQITAGHELTETLLNSSHFASVVEGTRRGISKGRT